MYLIDDSGALQYNNLKEKGYFNSILSSSAVLTLQTDSIVVDPVRKYFRYYGKQKIDRRSSTIIRSLVTEGYLKDLPIRSENNPHAVLITHCKKIGRASCRERVCQYVSISVVAVALKKKL